MSADVAGRDVHARARPAKVSPARGNDWRAPGIPMSPAQHGRDHHMRLLSPHEFGLDLKVLHSASVLSVLHPARISLIGRFC
jgi:hypothetical protein